MPCNRCSHRDLPCRFEKPSIRPTQSRASATQHGNLEAEAAQLEDGNISTHADVPQVSSQPEDGIMTDEYDPPTQSDFPWDLPDFPFPFASPFEIDPVNAGDVMFNYDRTPLSFGDTTCSYLSDPAAPTPRQMKNPVSLYTPNSHPDMSGKQASHAAQRKDQNSQAEPSFPGFPHFSPDDTDILISDDYCHVPEVSSSDYDALLRMYHESVPVSHTENRAGFPRREVTNAFVQLYFEFFHPGFNLLHQATFQHWQRSPVLLLAVAAIGCQYSRVTSRGQCSLALLEILRRALLGHVGLFTLALCLSEKNIEKADAF